MLLSDDVLRNVVRCVPRFRLDQILITNSDFLAAITSVSEPHSNTGSLRRVTMEVSKPSRRNEIDVELRTCEPYLVEPTVDDFDAGSMSCLRLKTLYDATRDSVIMNVIFAYADPSTIERFVPLARRWLNGSVWVSPQRFGSRDLFSQFFDQMVVTTGTLVVDLEHQPDFVLDAATFWALEAVKRCKFLRLEAMPPEALVTSAHVVAWLNAPHQPPEKKLLDVAGDAVVSLDDILDAVKADFERAAEPRPFSVKLYWRPTFEHWLGLRWTEVKLYNNATREKLHLVDVETSVTIDRQAF